jgi:hypothetical protein
MIVPDHIKNWINEHEKGSSNWLVIKMRNGGRRET